METCNAGLESILFGGLSSPVGLVLGGGILESEKPVFVLPVTTRTNKQKHGLTLHGCFIQMAGDLRGQGVTYPQKSSSHLISNQSFYKEKKG